MPDSNITPPPTYTEPSDHVAELKHSFMSLFTEDQEIRSLFDVVTTRLETTPQIGPDHPLAEEWTTLRKMYRDAYRDTRAQADRCATFLELFQDIVLPLSQSESSVPLHDRVDMVQQFIAMIDEYKQATHRTGSNRRASGLLCNTWSKITDFCSAIGKAISKLLDHFVTLIRQLFSEVKSVHMSMGPLRMSAHFGDDSRISEEIEMNPRGGIAAAPEIDDTARRIAEKVSASEFAWDAVRMSCDTLRIQLRLAGTTPSVAPDAVLQSQFEMVGLLYRPLVKSMRAYSVGRPPQV
ncbi:uncharacterized protein B0H18DRAFT_25487 [Fomitopsis serialis]|uniref:uncharacterized protein n=1 Tax=Fomitopsis serialis TaxID=139415 RepID=UPI002007E5C6|nr:uncharacterized protein B0H18DRAFT_25487 [Neoantrodia serialis]KAH9932454.1 hypothetical protein B0H18DRAFT_25487 [Neoantrodia serialis]